MQANTKLNIKFIVWRILWLSFNLEVEMSYKINQQLGEKIARERKRRDMTQEELAGKVKDQTATISNIERT